MCLINYKIYYYGLRSYTLNYRHHTNPVLATPCRMQHCPVIEKEYVSPIATHIFRRLCLRWTYWTFGEVTRNFCLETEWIQSESWPKQETSEDSLILMSSRELMISSRFFKDFDKLFVGVARLQFIDSSLFPYNPRQLMWPCLQINAWSGSSRGTGSAALWMSLLICRKLSMRRSSCCLMLTSSCLMTSNSLKSFDV